jgi:hypothetical protein
MKGGITIMNKKLSDEELKKLMKINQSDTPDIVRNRIDQTLESLPNKKSFKRKRIYRVVAAVVSFIILLGFVSQSPTISNAMKELPFIGSVFQAAGNNGLKNTSDQGFTEIVNQSVVDQGITVTVNEALYDGGELSIGFVVETTDEFSRLGDIRLFVNGRNIYTGGGGRGGEINEDQYAEIRNFTIKEELPDQFELVIQVKSVVAFVEGKQKEKKGNWNFIVPIQKLQDNVTTHEFKNTPSITFNDETITVKKATFTPAMTIFYLNIIEPLDRVESPDSDYFIERNFQVIDDKGMILESVGSSASGRPNHLNGILETEYQIKLTALDRIPEYVTIKPIVEKRFIDGADGETTVSTPARLDTFSKDNLSGDFPIVLDQGAVGELKITEAELLDDLIVLSYEAIGKNPYKQASSLLIEDVNGKRYRRDPIDLIRTEHSSYSYMATFPIDNYELENLKVITFEVEVPNIIEDLELKVPIE